ncbi:hypothetical protein TNIN_174561, partial [Trichonephila inaurata madagascariensis]
SESQKPKDDLVGTSIAVDGINGISTTVKTPSRKKNSVQYYMW